MTGHGNIDRFDQRQPRGDRQSLRGRVARLKLDQGAAVKIACGRKPGPSLPSPARLLVQRDQPVAFDGLAVGDQVGVG